MLMVPKRFFLLPQIPVLDRKERRMGGNLTNPKAVILQVKLLEEAIDAFLRLPIRIFIAKKKNL